MNGGAAREKGKDLRRHLDVQSLLHVPSNLGRAAAMRHIAAPHVKCNITSYYIYYVLGYSSSMRTP